MPGGVELKAVPPRRGSRMVAVAYGSACSIAEGSRGSSGYFQLPDVLNILSFGLSDQCRC